MSSLSIPNTVANGLSADGNEVGANFDAIQAWADDHVVEATAVALVPTGGILPFAGSTAPSGYLLADGTAVNRTTYADLFALIGTAYGVGDGSTTFNLPNLKARFPVGRDATVTAHDTLGETGGSRDAITVAHTHTGPSHTHSIPNHTHTFWTDAHAGHQHTHVNGGGILAGTLGNGTIALTTGGGLASESGFTALGGAHQHTGTTDLGGFSASGAEGTGATGSTGSSGTNANLSPYLVVNYIVKT